MITITGKSKAELEQGVNFSRNFWSFRTLQDFYNCVTALKDASKIILPSIISNRDFTVDREVSTATHIGMNDLMFTLPESPDGDVFVVINHFLVTNVTKMLDHNSSIIMTCTDII